MFGALFYTALVLLVSIRFQTGDRAVFNLKLHEIIIDLTFIKYSVSYCTFVLFVVFISACHSSRRRALFVVEVVEEPSLYCSECLLACKEDL